MEVTQTPVLVASTPAQIQEAYVPGVKEQGLSETVTALSVPHFPLRSLPTGPSLGPSGQSRTTTVPGILGRTQKCWGAVTGTSQGSWWLVQREQAVCM